MKSKLDKHVEKFHKPVEQGRKRESGQQFSPSENKSKSESDNRINPNVLSKQNDKNRFLPIIIVATAIFLFLVGGGIFAYFRWKKKRQ